MGETRYFVLLVRVMVFSTSDRGRPVTAKRAPTAHHARDVGTAAGLLHAREFPLSRGMPQNHAQSLDVRKLSVVLYSIICTRRRQTAVVCNAVYQVTCKIDTPLGRRFSIFPSWLSRTQTVSNAERCVSWKQFSTRYFQSPDFRFVFVPPLVFEKIGLETRPRGCYLACCIIRVLIACTPRTDH